MASFHFNDAYVTLGGTDLSDHVRSVTLNMSYDELDDTAMGDSHRSRLAGLGDASITLEFNQDFAASEVDATIWSNLGSTAAIVVAANGSTISSTNPSYTGTFLINEYPPLDGSVGDLATVSVTWPLADGDGIAKATS